MSEKWSVERDFVSPEVLDALICFGRNALHYPEQEDLCPANDRCLAIVRENQDRLKRLADGLDGLLERIDPAVDFLEHLKPFDIQSETEIIDDGLLTDSSGGASLRAHLKALDDFVYSCYSLESSSFFDDDRFAGLRAEAVQAVHDLADRMLALPLWKLIPVNTQRQLVLRDIPEEHRFRFPWYEQDSDLPEDALYLLAWRWAGNAPEQEPLPWEEQLSREVQADLTYSAHLQRMASLLRELPEAFASAHALAWEFHADLLGSRHPLPLGMTDREGIYVSRKLIADEILEQKPSVAWRFDAAAFAVGLLPDDRLDIFREIERAMKEGDCHLESLPGGFGAAMQSWMMGSLSTEDALALLHTDWQERFERESPKSRGKKCSRKELLQFLNAPDVVSRALKWGEADRLPAERASVIRPPVFSTKIRKLLACFADFRPSPRPLAASSTGEDNLPWSLFADDAFSLAAADSLSDADCLFLVVGPDGKLTRTEISVDLFEQHHSQGRLFCTGRLDLSPADPLPGAQSCGFLTEDGGWFPAGTFSLDSETHIFQAVIPLAGERPGRLRLVLFSWAA